MNSDIHFWKVNHVIVFTSKLNSYLLNIMFQVPDLFFPNEKSAEYHDVTVQNQVVNYFILQLKATHQFYSKNLVCYSFYA